LVPFLIGTVPVVKVLDFPFQRYADGISIQRRYVSDYTSEETRTKDMAVRALRNYPEWLGRTMAVQEHICMSLQSQAMYKNDTEGALRAGRLLLNELSYLMSNASVLDENEQVRFLECFDYPFNNSADVDFYSKLLLSIFPEFELDLCNRFIDSINHKDDKLRFYNQYVGNPVLQRNYLDQLMREERQPGADIHIYAAKKEEGSVYHDLGSLTFGNPLRNGSEYTWYNASYWIDLFPKLALRILRNVKYTGRLDLITENWLTIKKRFQLPDESGL
ncbi:MAG TPA: GH116 family glycosyl hydrolase, partial [Chitinispirillaceae bacterium]|nr:GH116 family glycosyl hydrolase [Chitinispirillaceae bacterium]